MLSQPPSGRPMIFGPASVRAFLAGTKLQTRRRMPPNVVNVIAAGGEPAMAYRVGERVWVREAFVIDSAAPAGIRYAATDRIQDPGAVLSPILMGRRHSRITLTIMRVRHEHLQDITEDDAIAEGVIKLPASGLYAVDRPFGSTVGLSFSTAREAYAKYWDIIHKHRYRWETNPIVSTLELRCDPCNIDDLLVAEPAYA